MADLKVKVGVDKSGFTTGLASMENSVKGFGNKVGGILAGAFAFDKIIQGFSNAIDKGDQLQDLANRFGVAASSIQEIGNAASLSGGSIEDVASAMNKLAKNAGEAIGGNEKLREAFRAIGLSVDDLVGKTPENLFFALSKAVASGSLGMRDFEIATELAGRGAATLMETMRLGPDVIQTTGQAMGVFGDETTEALSRASDAIKTFQNTLTLGFAAVIPVVQSLIERYQDLVEAVTLSISARFGSNLDAASRASLMEESSLKAGNVVFGRSKLGENQATPTLRNTEARTEQSGLNKAAEIEKNKLKSAEDRLADAVRDRESLTMDDAQKLGRAQAELLEMKIKESEIADKTLEKLQAQEEIERKKIEVLQLQKQIKNDLADAEADAIKAAGSGDLNELNKAQQRLERLQGINKQRGNAADFDPREALMQRFGLGDQLRDIPSSTEAQRTQPVRLENPPSLQGVLDKLDLLIKNAGVFS
jgi:hypothetical protein